MSFKIDKQTLNDLAIFTTGRTQSVYEIFNRTHTRGGGRLLEEMFRYPLSEVEAIASRSEAISFYMKNGAVFPFRGAIFDAIEFYLGNTDTRSQLMQENNTLGRKVKNLMGSDTDYVWIHNGIVGCLELLNTLEDFLKVSAGNENKDIADSTMNLKTLVANEKWQWYKNEKGQKKVSYERAVMYDRVFRFEERDKLQKILHYIYVLDVYMTVAEVAKSRNFVQAKVYPAEKNILKLRGVFHPFLKKPIGNNIDVDKDSNVIFLTGANMAGKSTLMKSFGIAVYMAHMGFPVAAKSMEFIVQDGMYTSINVPDNINMGYSHFYAEVLRVKKVAIEVSLSKKLVVIFDELFKGTNVKDAFDATLAVASALAKRRACSFLISTHIIEVGQELGKACDNVTFAYLPTVMDGKVPRYTYRLQPGITADKHGMIIINNDRIIETIRGEI